jgi:hypothetical protein
MRIGEHLRFRRWLCGATMCAIALALTACTGRGGGQLPPDGVAFTGPASFGFQFSCEDKGGVNPPTGRLDIQVSYTDHGRSLLGSSFGIHGTVDEIDPVLESQLCIGQNPPPPPENQLIFLGRYRVTSPAPPGVPSACASTTGAPTCRFEVIVRDNDKNRAPSTGDYFHITLSSTTALTSELYPRTVFYTRGGRLSSGNVTVD